MEQLDRQHPQNMMEFSCLSLDGLDVALPSQEEQASKRAKALDNLRAYVQACGGSLPQGWDCSLRCRITSRWHGRQGLTTDNYYYSPCGKTFRTHKQVVEHLGLTPVPREQLRQQQQQQQADNDSDSEELQPEHFNIISVTVLASAAASAPAKRSHSAMVSTDTEATTVRPAASAPAAVAASAAEKDQQAVTGCSPALSAPSTQSAPASVAPAKRTKAGLAAKYAASCSGGVSASLSVSTATMSVAAPAASGLPSSSSSLSTATHAASATASADVVACPQQRSPGLAGVRHAAEELAQLQSSLGLVTPAVSSNNSSSRRSSHSSSKAVSSSRQPVPKQPVPKQPVFKQPVPKPWKPRAQPAWRLKLRELATAAVLAEGLGPAVPSNDSAADSKSG